MRNLILAAFVACLPMAALAETQCGERLEVLDYLALHGYSLKIVAITNSGLKIEIYVGANKSWIMAATHQDKTTCLVSQGTGFAQAAVL